MKRLAGRVKSSTRRLKAALSTGRAAGLRAIAWMDIGSRELMLLIALVLVTVALWPMFQRRALLVPGVVLLWIALPPRNVFIVRPPSEAAVNQERRV